MTSFSVVALPLVTCSVTFFATVASWQIQNRLKTHLSNRRLALFRSGVVVGVLGLITTAVCYIDPFPLTQQLDGSLSIAWLERAWTMAFVLPVLSAVLAFFGRGSARILLLISNALSLFLALGSLLQNGV
jgi:uncharacterized membrane protein